jgi:hypothetical protein
LSDLYDLSPLLNMSDLCFKYELLKVLDSSDLSGLSDWSDLSDLSYMSNMSYSSSDLSYPHSPEFSVVPLFK